MVSNSSFFDALRANGSLLATKTVTAGFDGFLDKIVKIIKDKPEGEPAVHFRKIKTFGEYVLEKSAGSFSLELEELRLKIGGNMPITAHALGQLGVKVHCIGALGFPQIHPAFGEMSGNCQLHSFAEPGTSTACEFDNGKMMLADMGMLNSLRWSAIRDRIGIENLRSFYQKSDLLCLLNWSEIDASADIWKGILTDILPHCRSNEQRPIAFFDLSDCSKRSDEAISEMLDLLQQFGQYARVMLSLNKNEAQCIHQTLFRQSREKTLPLLAGEIFEKIQVDTLVLHSSRTSVAVNQDGCCTCETFFTAQPNISTGAGDHFNAGFAAAQLLNSDLEQALTFANAVSGCYVRNGNSPNLDDVIYFLEEQPVLS